MNLYFSDDTLEKVQSDVMTELFSWHEEEDHVLQCITEERRLGKMRSIANLNVLGVHSDVFRYLSEPIGERGCECCIQAMLRQEWIVLVVE